MDADDFGPRHGEEAEGIIIPKILFFGEGQQGEILHAFNVHGGNPQGLHLIAIEGHVLVHPAHHIPQALVLHIPQLLPGHTFHGLVPNHLVHGNHSSLDHL